MINEIDSIRNCDYNKSNSTKIRLNFAEENCFNQRGHEI